MAPEIPKTPSQNGVFQLEQKVVDPLPPPKTDAELAASAAANTSHPEDPVSSVDAAKYDDDDLRGLVGGKVLNLGC